MNEPWSEILFRVLGQWETTYSQVFVQIKNWTNLDTQRGNEVLHSLLLRIVNTVQGSEATNKGTQNMLWNDFIYN